MNELITATKVTPLPISRIANNRCAQSVDYVLNSRCAVFGIVAFFGPMGLLALWFSPRFSKGTKFALSAGYAVLTTIVPLLIAWYWLDYSLRPLVDVFGK